MARIRTIKPDFWTDEQLTECSMSARLLFIGMWNFADDNGNLNRSPKKIKMQVFPADLVDCEPLIQELIAHGRIIEYSVNEELFLHIKGFKKHQVINRPSASSIPEPDFNEDSRKTPRGKGREGKGVKTLSGKPDESRDQAKEILLYLNSKAGKEFRPVDANLDMIVARIKEGASLEDCKTVVDAKVAQWGDDDKMAEYLRPGTLFNRTKFAQYIGAGPTANGQPWEGGI
jgi:uncharacterized phage protein (TIGR02220 family)